MIGHDLEGPGQFVQMWRGPRCYILFCVNLAASWVVWKVHNCSKLSWPNQDNCTIKLLNCGAILAVRNVLGSSWDHLHVHKGICQGQERSVAIRTGHTDTIHDPKTVWGCHVKIMKKPCANHTEVGILAWNQHFVFIFLAWAFLAHHDKKFPTTLCLAGIWMESWDSVS